MLKDKYNLKIDREVYTVDKSTLTGKEILELCGKTPFNRWLLNLRLKGGIVRKVDYEESVDLTNPGIEKFMTLPMDQTDGESHETIIDLEDYSKNDKKVPAESSYRIKIDRDKFVVHKQTITGKELLEIAGKTPCSRWLLNLRIKGGIVKPIGYDEVVDLTLPGIEKFMTLPLDQTDGELRKQFSLPEEDVEYLESLGLQWETIKDGNSLWLIVYDFSIFAGYNHLKTRIAIKIENGYPVTQLDMVYFYPALEKFDKSPIKQISNQVIDGLTFQRWSRHRTGENPWRAGVDDISAHITLIQYWLERELNPIHHAV